LPRLFCRIIFIITSKVTKQIIKKPISNMAKKDSEFKPKSTKKKGGSGKLVSGFMLFSKENRAKIKEGKRVCVCLCFSPPPDDRPFCLYVPLTHCSSITRIVTENPDITFGGTGKKLGEMWRALSDKEKAAFKERKG